TTPEPGVSMCEGSGSSSSTSASALSGPDSSTIWIARIVGLCPKHRGGVQAMAKVLCVLYDDPVDGYPRSYARDRIPVIERYHDGQTTPTPEGIDFEPGELLGSVSGELGLRPFLEERGHTLVVTSDKDGPDSVFE